jgi:UDP-GlcNAc:undecaprenyl-phosphate GlcNAc-1-phosphate transferase
MGLERVTDHVIALNLENWIPVLVGAAMVFLVGVWDDLRRIPAWAKFLIQAAAAGIAIWFGIRIERVSFLGSDITDLGLFTVPITFLWIVGITNAFNLVDGLDGLAAGLASIAAGTCAAIFLLRGDVQDGIFLLVLLGALIGFLRYNFNPATIFLGDSGSLFVGYALAVTAVRGSQKGATALAVVIPLLVFGLPILDTLLSMVRRFLGGLTLVNGYKAPLKDRVLCAKRMFEADRGHIHHRLIALGLSHRNAVLMMYTIAFGLSLMALTSVLAQFRNAGIILTVVALATYIGIHELGYQELAFLRTGTLLRWYEQLMFNRLFFLGFVDMVLITAAYWGSFVLKYDRIWVAELKAWYLNVFPMLLAVQLGVFYVAGLYRGVWRAMGMGDVIRVVLAVGAAVFLASTFSMIIEVPPDGAYAFFCIDFLLLVTVVLGARSFYRVLDYLGQRENLTGRTALIYGAGRGGQLVFHELLQNSRLGLRPIGFLDDNLTLHGRTINRVPVLGSSYDLASVLEAVPVNALIISSDKIKGDRLHQVIDLCRKRQIAVLQGRLRFEIVGLDGVPSSEAPARQTSMGHETNPPASPDLSRTVI